MNKLSKLFLIIIFFFIFETKVYASSVSIKSSANSVNRGSSVTVTASVLADSNIFSVEGSVYCTGAGVNSGIALNYTNTDMDKKSFSKPPVKLIPSSSGTITCKTENVTIWEENSSNGYKLKDTSITINVTNNNSSGTTGTTNETKKEIKEYSSDNTLSSLSIDGYEITPKFNKDTLEYKLEVDEDVEKITIKGKTTDDKAEINGTGEKALTEGENKIEVKVTAENGNEKIYKIIVTVKDKNPITVTIDNKKYTIVKKNKDAIKKLDHYEEEKIKINNQEVISYINKVTKTRLVILKDKDNKLAYYIYNENTKKYQKYKSISVGNITLQILDYNKKIDNYKLYNIKINNEDIDIYKTKKNDEFGLIYGINIVTGNKSFYQYDEKEQTLARYNSKKNNNKLNIYKEETNKYKNYLMVSIGIICLILIIVLITSLIKSKKHKRKS